MLSSRAGWGGTLARVGRRRGCEGGELEGGEEEALVVADLGNGLRGL